MYTHHRHYLFIYLFIYLENSQFRLQYKEHWRRKAGIQHKTRDPKAVHYYGASSEKDRHCKNKFQKILITIKS